ncbi:hypothetical protein [Candidatus Cardinium hertigii]|uniref:hypothetical protein n=1 Tax=Candidatus Cardinium hertigii TaxID=247481 RepID=UPI003D7DB8C8
MNRYKIKSFLFSALWGMAVLNSGGASCSKEKKLKDLTDQQLIQNLQETMKECLSREGSRQGASEKEIEDNIKIIEEKFKSDFDAFQKR